MRARRTVLLLGAGATAGAIGVLLGIRARAEARRHRRLLPPGPHPRRRLGADGARLGLLDRQEDAGPVTDADLASVPPPVARWMRRAGVVGRPRPNAVRVRLEGRIRLRPEQRWMPLEAWQLDVVEPVSRVFRMRIVVGGVVPMYGTDSYLDGRGRMIGKVAGAVTVAEGAGREFDLGELVTWLNDAVLLAPSMLLRPEVEWRAVTDRSFEVTLTDGSNRVRAHVELGDDDLPIDFATDDRWYAGTDPPTRTRWRTPVRSWTTASDGRPVPGATAAVWELPGGDFRYVEGRFDAASLDLDPAG